MPALAYAFGLSFNELPQATSMPALAYAFGLSLNEMPQASSIPVYSYAFGLSLNEVPKATRGRYAVAKQLRNSRVDRGRLRTCGPGSMVACA